MLASALLIAIAETKRKIEPKPPLKGSIRTDSFDMRGYQAFHIYTLVRIPITQKITTYFECLREIQLIGKFGIGFFNGNARKDSGTEIM